MEATTSSAVIVRPSWNFTPERSAKVQTLPSAFGFQEVGELRAQLQVRSADDEEVAVWCRHAERAEVGAGDGVDGPGRHRLRHPDRPARPPGLGAGRRRERHPGGVEQRCGGGQPEAEARPVQEKSAPAQAAGQELVDEPVLDLAAVPPHPAQPIPEASHVELSLLCADPHHSKFRGKAEGASADPPRERPITRRGDVPDRRRRREDRWCRKRALPSCPAPSTVVQISY
jgi:hypothetical protein